MLCIDIVLDPIAVNEKRWAWSQPEVFMVSQFSTFLVGS